MKKKTKADDHLMADMYETPEYLKACLLQEQCNVDALLQFNQSLLAQLAETERAFSELKLKETQYIQEISVLKKDFDDITSLNINLSSEITIVKGENIALEEDRSQLSQQLIAATKDIEEEATAMNHWAQRFASMPANDAKDIFIQMCRLMIYNPNWIKVALVIENEFSGRLMRIEQAAMRETLPPMNIGNLTITDIEHNHAPVVDNHEGGVLEIPIINY